MKVENARLGDVATFVRGITFKPDDVGTPWVDGLVGCMRTKNVQQQLDLSDVWGIPPVFVRRPEQFLQTGDILVSTANSWNLVGKCCLVDRLPGPTTLGGFISALRIDPLRANPRYVFHWFASGGIQAELRACGRQTTNISNLDLDRSLNLRLYLPSLYEQQRIAAILDQADALRTKRRQALTNYRRLTEALFTELFGSASASSRWPEVRFSETFAEPLRNGLSPSKAGKHSGTVLTLSAITGSHFKPEARKEAHFAVTPPSKQTVSIDEFLICRGNGNLNLVGRGQRVTVTLRDVLFPDTIIAATLDPKILNPQFLQQIWNGASMRMQIEAVARTTNGTYKVNQTMLENVTLMCPPLTHQEQFAKSQTAIAKEAACAEIALVQSDALFASLQHRAFRGEL